MSTHHAQTALRYIDFDKPDAIPVALVHAQLETAAQTERIADGIEKFTAELEKVGEFLAGIFDFATRTGMLQMAVRQFNPEDN